MGVGEGTARSSRYKKKTIRKLKQWRRRRQRERQKKQVGLDWQNNNFARASSIFVHFVAVIIRLQCESA